MFTNIIAETYKNAEAEKAKEAINTVINSVACEQVALARAGADLVTNALEADPEDAPKLAKAVEALRVRRLRNLMLEMQVPRLKAAAQAVLRAAAAAEVIAQQEGVEIAEESIHVHATSLGYSQGDRFYQQILVSDPNRRNALQTRNRVQLEANNLQLLTDADKAREAELRKEIEAALK